ncbi:DinB family protein [Danxiaibacter flavus]|uniref:DinB family protein n=1 Tax=Danxiaibacter flavus TaxID=3049108 RepID=A0ABV3ZM18_9BACT|nr:DinB family protein [Chitinophagaceae bacterium DXS]
MKEYFLRMFQYDYNSNLQILHTILNSDNNKKVLSLMAHLLGAQQVWLHRCKRETGGVIWPEWEAEQIALAIEENFVQWKTFIESSQPGDFEKMIDYKNSRGESFSNRLVDILTQVTNHGTHHRAQIGQLLKFDGVQKLPVTDYIFFIRESAL